MTDKKNIAELTVRIKVEYIEPINKLVGALCEHLDELPKPVYDALQSVIDYENGV